MKGKIVLIKFDFTDMSSSKVRPALVLIERDQDVVVAYITSIIPDPIDETCQIIIESSHPEFALTGLVKDSALLLDKVATYDKSLIKKEIGEIGPVLTDQINEILQNLYKM